jgi:menaquinone-dependent protoporphyrinogen oxidase
MTHPSDPSATAPGPAHEGPRPHVIVAYATKHGSAAEISAAIVEVLREAGLEAEARPAAEVRSLRRCDAVILGSGLYSATWLREANRFVRAHSKALAGLPVWLFSSGPLDRSADFDDIPMTAHVAEAIDGLAIRGHRTFGGRLVPEAPEVAAGIIATHRTGDFRDFDAIRAWAREIAAALA